MFQFAISPALININRMDLSQHVTLNCDSTYFISYISYSSGILTINTEYSEDMEDRQCVLNLTFNSTVIISP